MNIIEYGDNRTTMKKWHTEGVKAQMCVTSPPYFGLRSYLDDTDPNKTHEIGFNQSLSEYVASLVETFRCVWDLLEDDGTLWLNIGDSYYGGGGYSSTALSSETSKSGKQGSKGALPTKGTRSLSVDPNIKPKDLIGVPWRLAFALQDDGWYLRSDIIWEKGNVMPESVRDRPTRSHEYLFLLSKSEKYYYDHVSILEPHNLSYVQARKTFNNSKSGNHRSDRDASFVLKYDGKPIGNPLGRNKRDVWHVNTAPYKGSHFAVFPPKLIEPCIKAGSKINDIVLDPFMGSGTTASVCIDLERQYLGCELNESYKPLIEKRLYESVNKERYSELFSTEIVEMDESDWREIKDSESLPMTRRS